MTDHMPATASGAALSPMQVARLKIDLLATGLRLAPDAQAVVGEHGKPALRVRSGSCGGLDVVLPGGICVNAPIHERFAMASPFVLDRLDGEERLAIVTPDGTRVPVDLVP